MSEQQLDAQGEAHQALSTVVTDYGQRVLSDPRMIGNIVTDLLPDLPRERGLLVTAAEADVAGELTQRVQHQHLDPDTAVQMVARSLIERKSIDPAASMWVTTEYAQALGYPVRPAALSAAPLGATPPLRWSALLRRPQSRPTPSTDCRTSRPRPRKTPPSDPLPATPGILPNPRHPKETRHPRECPGSRNKDHRPGSRPLGLPSSAIRACCMVAPPRRQHW
jgi:hypothetical protein